MKKFEQSFTQDFIDRFLKADENDEFKGVREKLLNKDKVKDRSGEEQFTYKKLVHGLKNNKFKKIVFMTGAGISVSAGIPDFRSPKTGFYDNLDILKEFNLPSPQSVFDIEYFIENPKPFYKIADDHCNMENYEATPTHHFFKMLHDKKIVSHYLTQNIDNLEAKAGFTPDQMIQAHGA